MSIFFENSFTEQVKMREAHIMFMWSVVFKNGYYEHFLSNENNRAAITTEIPATVSGLDENIFLSAEVWDNKWNFLENRCISFEGDKKTVPLLDDLQIKCTVRESSEPFVVLVSEITDAYTSFKKYKTPSSLKIGREADNDICLSDQLVGRHHASFEVNNGICTLTDTSINGTFINSLRVKPNVKHTLEFGDSVWIYGLKIVFLGDYIAVNNPAETMAIQRIKSVESLTSEQSATALPDTYFQRSPRTVTRLDTEPVAIDTPPSPQQARRQPLLLTIGPALTMVIPMAAGMLFMLLGTQAMGGTPSPFLFMGIVTSSTAAVLGVFWALMNVRHARRAEADAEEKRKSAYKSYIERICNTLEERQNHNRDVLNAMYPSAETCFTFTQPKILRLWERNVNHADFLTVRLGMGTRRSPNEIQLGKESFTLTDNDMAEEPRKVKAKYDKLRNVPVCISLLEHRLVGILAKNENTSAEIARIIATQLAACHSYSDLRMIFLYNAEQESEYSFARWLPHTWSEYGSLRMAACDKIGADEIFYDLSNVLRKRSESENQDNKVLPHYVVFVADSAIMEDEPMAKHFYDPQEAQGLSVILLYDKIGLIPNSCSVVIRRDDEYSGYYSLEDAFEGFEGVTFDSVPKEAMENFSRKLSGFRLREARQAGAIPDKLTYLEMYDAVSLEDIDVYRNWLENRTYESMRAVIGYRNADTPLYLDIHEKAHGPHGLVAGTTGSGKSEMLQTYILSLATRYHPHEVSFVLIDYKGGGMAQSFIGLPHITGIITNLGGNQTNRALAAINSEVKRRQTVFSSYSLKHIDEYIELYRGGSVSQPMPHLLIIADEFAELKKEQGNFVQELISIARVGRSLGVHLILATQKPSASVDDEIQSNSRFRLCLRVQDKQDSMDMIRCPDAASITIPGRGYFQVGNNELFESFQSGWSGAPYDPVAAKDGNKGEDVRMINLWGKRLLGKKRRASADSANTNTQLSAMVEHIRATAEEKQIEPLAPIWLPPLPERLVLQQNFEMQASSIEAQIGLADDPSGQRQMPLSLDLISTGHILVAATAGGGKTTFLQTLLYSLVTRYTPQDLHCYVLDLGSRSLGIFSTLPHIGGVAFDSDSDKIDKLISLLVKEVKRRKLRLAEKSIGTFKEYRQEYNDLPAILLVIDNYAAFTENYGRYDDTMISFSREAASLGMYMVITCVNANEVRGRIRQNFNFGIGLQLNDRFEYEDVLGMRLSFAPDDMPGRGLIRDGANVLEFQTALCVDAPNTAGINAAIRSQFESICANWNGATAAQIPQVPEDMSIGTIKALPAVREKIESGRYLPLGYDLKEATPLFIDFGETFCYTIGGAERTGKTTLLKALLVQAKEQKALCYVYDSPAEELKSFAQNQADGYMNTSESLFEFMRDTLIPEFMKRNKAKDVFLQNEQKDLDGYLASESKICLFINNMEAFCEAIYTSENDMKGFVEQMLTKGDNHMVYLFACVSNSDMISEWNSKPVMRKYISRKDGIHLGGAIDKQRIFSGFDVPPLESGKRLSAGIGHTVEQGMTKRVTTIR